MSEGVGRSLNGLFKGPAAITKISRAPEIGGGGVKSLEPCSAPPVPLSVRDFFPVTEVFSGGRWSECGGFSAEAAVDYRSELIGPIKQMKSVI